MTSYTRLRFGDVRWRVRFDAADLLFDSAGLRLPSWLKSGQASIVKQGPHRTVYRVELNGRSVYIKHYRVADVRAMLSQWAQSSKGRREWDHVEQAARCAIPTLVPLALGEQRKAGLVLENYLVTEGIEDVEPLDKFVQYNLAKLSPPQQGRVRRRLAEGLAELIARMHEAGMLHPDLHAGNVLVRFGEPDKIELFLIDMQEAVPASYASWRRSRQDLLAFGLFFFTMARRLDRARFLRRYLELRPQLGLDWKEEARKLERKLRKKALGFWRRLDYRCVTNNRRFFCRDVGSAHGFAVAEMSEAAFLALLRDPDTPFRSPQAEVLKESASSDVVRLPMSLGQETTAVIYKRFNCPKRLDPVRATLHHSPALRAWQAGHGLLTRRIPTPRPLAVIERTRGMVVCETYLVTQAIPDSLSLKDYLVEIVANLPPDIRHRRLRRLTQLLAQLVRTMHDRNISHRDMKASNFLVTPADAAAESPAVCLIDLAGVQIWRRLPTYRRLQNLMRILVSLQSFSLFSRTDYLRALFAYQPSARRDPAQWKEIWRYLQVRATYKIARNQKLRRPVG